MRYRIVYRFLFSYCGSSGWGDWVNYQTHSDVDNARRIRREAQKWCDAEVRNYAGQTTTGPRVTGCQTQVLDMQIVGSDGTPAVVL